MPPCLLSASTAACSTGTRLASEKHIADKTHHSVSLDIVGQTVGLGNIRIGKCAPQGNCFGARVILSEVGCGEMAGCRVYARFVRTIRLSSSLKNVVPLRVPWLQSGKIHTRKAPGTF